ncbi:MAG: RNA polymerase sigma-70 factor (ECF subfamily) [Planctomycetota bacterium]|jgi:RNA polymerase sigma-70 factor (ECF subfamily)
MTDSNQKAPIDSLLEHATWVGQLARSLVGSEQADDLTQDLWVSALRHPPRVEGNLKGWLKRVLVHRAQHNHRGERRRSDREQHASSSGVIDDPAERFDAHRDLVQRVGELEDPWRRTILWRYFDELSLKEIAKREGVPISTVNTRLRKAKELLREKLDEDHQGNRRAWMIALAPLARDFQPLAPLTPIALSGMGAPLLLMKLPHLLAALAAASVAAILIYPENDAEPLEQEAIKIVALEQSTQLAPLVEAPSSLSSPREVQRLEQSEPDAASSVELGESELQLLSGRVIDSEGRPMAELDVWFSGEGEDRLLGITESDGGFPVDPERDIGLIEVRDDVWGTAISCRFPRGSRQGPTLVVAKWIDVAGVVRNEEGEFIELAQLVSVEPRSLRTSIPDLHGKSVSHSLTARTDEFGFFRFEDALAMSGTTLYAQAQGYSDAEVEFPSVSTQSFEVVMSRPDAAQGVVVGEVVDSRGQPVPSAWVSLGYLSTTTDRDGRFQIEQGQEGNYNRLIAAMAGHQPAILPRPTDSITEEVEPWPDFVRLQLGEAPLELVGQVTDTEGQELADWKVWLADPTFFSSIDQLGVMVEGLAQDLQGTSNEDDGPTASWPWTRTDSGGRFVLGGLMDRDYQIKLLHVESMLLVDAGPFAAGRRDVRIVLDLEDLYTTIEGRVVDNDGQPISGVSVSNWVVTNTTPHGQSGILWHSESGEPTTTDEDGRYRFNHLPKNGVTIKVDHPDLLPQEVELRRGEDGKPVNRKDWDAIDFVCERRFHLQIEISPAIVEEGGIVILDREEQPSMIQVFSAGGHMSTNRYRFENPKTEVLSLSGDVREIVLYDSDGTELTRQTLNLTFGELNTVRF